MNTWQHKVTNLDSQSLTTRIFSSQLSTQTSMSQTKKMEVVRESFATFLRLNNYTREAKKQSKNAAQTFLEQARVMGLIKKSQVRLIGNSLRSPKLKSRKVLVQSKIKLWILNQKQNASKIQI